MKTKYESLREILRDSVISSHPPVESCDSPHVLIQTKDREKLFELLTWFGEGKGLG